MVSEQNNQSILSLQEHAEAAMALVLSYCEKIYKPEISRLQKELLESVHDSQLLMKRADMLQYQENELIKEKRYLQEEQAQLKVKLQKVQDELMQSQLQAEKQGEQLSHYERQLIQKEEAFMSKELEGKKMTLLLADQQKEWVDQERRRAELESEVIHWKQKSQQWEGIAAVKEQLLFEKNQQYVHAEEEAKKCRKEKLKKEEEFYKLSQDLDVTKNHLTFLREDFQRYKNKNPNQQ